MKGKTFKAMIRSVCDLIGLSLSKEERRKIGIGGQKGGKGVFRNISRGGEQF